MAPESQNAWKSGLYFRQQKGGTEQQPADYRPDYVESQQEVPRVRS